MGYGEKKQGPRPDPPPLDGTLEVLRELLSIEQERLATAVRIEKERSIVFPETTIIIRDIQKLVAAIEAKEHPERPEQGGWLAGLEIDF